MKPLRLGAPGTERPAVPADDGRTHDGTGKSRKTYETYDTTFEDA